MKLELFVETLEGSRRRKMFPVHFSCVSSVDTPADSIKATFLISHPKEWMKEIKALELQGDGNRLFHGICDRQIVSLQQDGRRGKVLLFLTRRQTKAANTKRRNPKCQKP